MTTINMKIFEKNYVCVKRDPPTQNFGVVLIHSRDISNSADPREQGL